MLGDEEINDLFRRHAEQVGCHWCGVEALEEYRAELFARAIEEAVRQAGPEVPLGEWIERKRKWSESAFGHGERTLGVIEHIRCELDEILANPDDVEEWIDVILLAIDGARRRGFSGDVIARALVEKQEKNERRSWGSGGQGDPIFHEETTGEVKADYSDMGRTVEIPADHPVVFPPKASDTLREAVQLARKEERERCAGVMSHEVLGSSAAASLLSDASASIDDFKQAILAKLNGEEEKK